MLKQLLFATAVMFCFSIAAFAQKPDDKKPPPKDPPVVIVKDKNPKDENKPKNNENKDNKGKKPQAFVIELENDANIIFV